MSNILDEKLFNALIQVRDSGGVLEPKTNSDNDRKSFDDLVSKIFALRKFGYLQFDDSEVIKDRSMGSSYRYYLVHCTITYDGQKALSYQNYEDYRNVTPQIVLPHIVNNIVSIKGNVNHSNIASGSGNNIGIENLTIQLPMDEIVFLTHYAEKNGISISELVHRHIRELRKIHESEY